MALNVNSLEGNEIADDFKRNFVPQGRWSDTWSVFKSNFFKIFLINIFVLISLIPAIVVLYFRSVYVSSMGMIYPFNSSIVYPFYPDVRGLTERLYLSADLMFYSLLIVAGFIASVGISGAVYSVRKLLQTHGKFTVKGFFHGVKVGYFNTVLPITIFLVFLFASKAVGDWKDWIIAIGGNKAGAITAYVFMVIANVLVGLYCAWLLAVGTSYRVKFTQLFKSSFVLMISMPVHTIFMAGFALIPVWIYMIGGILQWFAYIIFFIFGFSFIVLCWMSFAQWVFDSFITPNVKAAEEQEKSAKSDKELAQEKEEDEKRVARELLAAGKSELIARPIMPIAGEVAVQRLGKTFTRGDIAEAWQNRKKLEGDVLSYEEAHKNDAVYVEYNKLFAEREKALQTDSGKKGKKKKISPDNLLR